jgi:hypothetical protein
VQKCSETLANAVILHGFPWCFGDSACNMHSTSNSWSISVPQLIIFHSKPYVKPHSKLTSTTNYQQQSTNNEQQQNHLQALRLKVWCARQKHWEIVHNVLKAWHLLQSNDLQDSAVYHTKQIPS